MGHEYVEMKNAHAAIEAYRRAVGKVTLLSRIYHSCNIVWTQISIGKTTEPGMALDRRTNS